MVDTVYANQVLNIQSLQNLPSLRLLRLLYLGQVDGSQISYAFCAAQYKDQLLSRNSLEKQRSMHKMAVVIIPEGAMKI
jgi:hypothetical protein